MKCIKCGCNIAEDSVFCTECGASQDGRIKCKKCGTLNSSNEEICTKCHARLDGKAYCPKCGTLTDGTFCVECGTRVKASETVLTPQPVVYASTPIVNGKTNKKTPFEIFKSIERIVTPCLLLFIMFLLFCCSFGVGFSVDAYGASGTLLKENLGAFPKTGGGMLYFFGQSFAGTTANINSHPEIAGSALARFGLQLPNVICLIALLANFITIVTLFIISSIKTGVSLKKGEKVNIFKYVLTAFVCFFVTATIVKEANYIYMDYNYYDFFYSESYYYVSMSIGSIIGIIFPIPIFILAFILEQVGKGKQFACTENLIKIIPGAITTLFVLIVMGFLGEGVIIDVRMIGEDNYAQTEYSTTSLLSYLCFKIAGGESGYGGQFALYLTSMILRIGAIITYGAVLRMTAGVMFEEKSYAKPLLITTIVSILLCVLTSIIPICLYVEMINTSVSSVLSGGGLGAGTNAPLILSLVVLGGVITYAILSKKWKKKESKRQ